MLVLAVVPVTQVLYMHNRPRKWGLYFPHFTDEDTEIQGSVNNPPMSTYPGGSQADFKAPSLSLHCTDY